MLFIKIKKYPEIKQCFSTVFPVFQKNNKKDFSLFLVGLLISVLKISPYPQP